MASSVVMETLAPRAVGQVVTLCFTDMENSTPLVQEFPEDWPEILTAHRDLIRTAFHNAGARQVDADGEELVAVFDVPADAVVGAVAAQVALMAHGFPGGANVRVRMGLHSGNPLFTAEGMVGLDVHRAARISSAAHGGQILVSDTTRLTVPGDMPSGVGFRDLGLHNMKGLANPEHLHQVVATGLPLHFPPPRTLTRLPESLPIEPNALLGRETELAALHTMLSRAEVRLVTLTGPGGVGKTRLAVEAASTVALRFRDGVSFVSLAGVRDPDGVIPAIARAVGINEGASAQSLAGQLSERQMLLVLDNFEQVIAAAPDVAQLLAVSPGLTVLSTSREALGVRGERELAVEPLPVPPSGANLPDVAGSPAIRLYVERAALVRPGFAVTAENASTLSAICRHLDGLPLAIELVAARSKLLPPARVLERLERVLDFATSGPRDLPARHQSLRAAIAWSYELLPETERVVLRHLGVFAGPFTVEAAQAVVMPVVGRDLPDQMEALCSRSLVRIASGPDEDPRFSLLDAIRHFCLEQLSVAGELETARERHLRWYRDQTVGSLARNNQARHVASLADEWGELRAALSFSLTTPQRAVLGLSLATAAGALFWQQRPTEGCSWLGRALAMATDAPLALRARAQYWFTFLGLRGRDVHESVACAEACVATATAAGHPATMAIALNILGESLIYTGELDRAWETCTTAVARAHETGEAGLIAMTNGPLGLVAQARGDLETAAAAWHESCDRFREAGDDLLLASPLLWLSGLDLARGDCDSAERWAVQGLQLLQRTGDVPRLADALAGLALVRLHTGDLAVCRSLLQQAIESIRQPATDAAELPDPGWPLVATSELAARQGRWGDAVALLTYVESVAHGASRRAIDRASVANMRREAEREVSAAILNDARTRITSAAEALELAHLVLADA